MASESRPNILFIITDQQFADAMSCRMGKEFLHTPNMDRPAQTGTLFTRAYGSNPLCMPWRNSVFTGRYPHETRVTRNAVPKGGNYLLNVGPTPEGLIAEPCVERFAQVGGWMVSAARRSTARLHRY